MRDVAAEQNRQESLQHKCNTLEHIPTPKFTSNLISLASVAATMVTTMATAVTTMTVATTTATAVMTIVYQRQSVDDPFPVVAGLLWTNRCRRRLHARVRVLCRIQPTLGVAKVNQPCGDLLLLP